MAITTLDGVVAGMQPPVDFAKTLAGTQVVNRYYSPFYTAGYPGAAVAPSPGAAGAALTTYAGQLPFVNGASDQYLARFSAFCNQPGSLLLCDRLWHNSGIVITQATAQTINSVAWPARDANASTNGEGVRVGLEVSTVCGAATPTLTLAYTNQAGTAGRTATTRILGGTASIVGSFYDWNLQAGDTGVRSIQAGYTQSVSWVSGVVHLVAYRVLARLSLPAANLEYAVDALTSGMPKMHDNTVPFLLFAPSVVTAPTQLQGQFIQTNG